MRQGSVEGHAADMGNQLRDLAIVDNSAGLLEAVRARADELNVSRLTLDEKLGVAKGYTAKVLCGLKRLSERPLDGFLREMGLVLIVAEDVEATERLRATLQVRQRPPSRKYVPMAQRAEGI